MPGVGYAILSPMKPPLLLLLLLFPTPARAGPSWWGTVAVVVDGDTIIVSQFGTEVEFDLYLIDAPELDQSFGKEAAVSLRALIRGKRVADKVHHPHWVNSCTSICRYKIFSPDYSTLLGIQHHADGFEHFVFAEGLGEKGDSPGRQHLPKITIKGVSC